MRLIYGTLRWLASIIDSDGQNNNRVSRYIDWRLFDATAQNTSSLSVETEPQRVRWKIRLSNNNWCAWNYVNARPASIAGLLTHVLCVKDGSQSSGKILLHTSTVLQTNPLAARQRSLYEMN